MDLPDRSLNALSRRALLLGGTSALTLLAVSRQSHAHNDAGSVNPPVPPPALALTLHDGSNTTLSATLSGKITALQLMFTSCGATCPIQGALFAKAAKNLGDRVKAAQWLSISIDPSRDDPAALKRWLERFGSHPRWRAGRPDPKRLDALVEFLKSKKAGPDPHTPQVYFFNRKGELTLRSVDFPPASELERVMETLSARA
jgi:protein SCO1/2